VNKKFCVIILFVFLLSVMGASQSPRRLILLSNDDGFDSPGIKALAKEFRKMGSVILVAPRKNASGAGHSITYKGPIFYKKIPLIKGVDCWWIDAKPATCVKWAMDNLFPERTPDLVISGINKGANFGRSVYYSGTIGAAREGALNGVPSIAFSMSVPGKCDYAGAAVIARNIAETYLQMDSPPLLLNINFPNCDVTAATPIKITRLTYAKLKISYDNRKNPQKENDYFWVLWTGIAPPQPGTDLAILQNGAISVTPLIIETTAFTQIAPLEKALQSNHRPSKSPTSSDKAVTSSKNH